MAYFSDTKVRTSTFDMREYDYAHRHPYIGSALDGVVRAVPGAVEAVVKAAEDDGGINGAI